MTLFHRSIDRAILLVTLLRRLRLRKIDFGTFQLGIAQLVPRVSGSPSPLPAPKTREKKKFRKKVPNPPPSPPPIDWKSTGAIGKNFPIWLKRPLEFRQATKPLGDPELSPGRRSSPSLKRALVRLLQPNPHRAPKVNQSKQTSLHRYLPWPIISTLTS